MADPDRLSPKVERRFLRAVRSSGLVKEPDLERAIDLQRHAAEQGRYLPLDRILLKLGHLKRDQILGLWRALRYYLWRREDKKYVKLALQSKLLTPDVAKTCLREQKSAYKHEDQLVRINEIARQRGYLKAAEDRALVEALHRIKPVTLRPVDDERAAEGFEMPSPGAARPGKEAGWRREARQQDLDDLRAHLAEESSLDALSSRSRGVSDPDLDALWDEADLDDVELDSQAIEIARNPLDLLEDSGEDDDLDLD
ncbi:MAG: hypothetical protein KF878_31375 [Planctomycetes bacterium]|nr:hypothetical protein [Planctomycetota bacterium]